MKALADTDEEKAFYHAYESHVISDNYEGKFGDVVNAESGDHHTILFHTNQSIYLEFGSIVRYDCVAVGSNKCLLRGRGRIAKF